MSPRPMKNGLPTVVITGGGTGGHLYPALAVAEELRRQRPDWNYRFYGRNVEREKQEVEKRGFAFIGLPLQGLKRKLTLNNIKTVWLALCGVAACFKHMRRSTRGAVFGVGGYVSAPAMVAGKLLGWPVTLHEQNTVPGLVTRRLAKLCQAVFVTFEKTREYLQGAEVVVTGFPLRPELLQKKEPLASHTNRPFTFLVVGGSQGARRLVEVTLQAFQQLRDLGIAHQALVQTGERNHEWAASLPRPEAITLAPYITDMANAYNTADLIISRAGSGTLSEIACWGLPSILVPYPYASENHQKVNAQVFAEAGAAIAVEESDLTSERLTQHLQTLTQDNERLQAMSRRAVALAREDAAQRIAQRLITIVEAGP